MLNIPIIDSIIDSISITKIGFLVLNIALIIFLIVVFIQVGSLERIFKETHDSTIIKAIAGLMLIFAISLFLLALVIL